jgi:hypothetical protein
MKNDVVEEKKRTIDSIPDFIGYVSGGDADKIAFCHELFNTSLRTEFMKDSVGCEELFSTLFFLFSVDENIYNDYFGMSFTVEQYSELFKKLEDIGLIGFYFHVKEFMLDMIKMTTINEVIDTVHKIDSNSDLFGNTRLLYIDICSKLRRLRA